VSARHTVPVCPTGQSRSGRRGSRLRFPCHPAHQDGERVPVPHGDADVGLGGADEIARAGLCAHPVRGDCRDRMQQELAELSVRGVQVWRVTPQPERQTICWWAGMDDGQEPGRDGSGLYWRSPSSAPLWPPSCASRPRNEHGVASLPAGSRMTSACRPWLGFTSVYGTQRIAVCWFLRSSGWAGPSTSDACSSHGWRSSLTRKPPKNQLNRVTVLASDDDEWRSTR